MSSAKPNEDPLKGTEPAGSGDEESDKSGSGSESGDQDDESGSGSDEDDEDDDDEEGEGPTIQDLLSGAYVRSCRISFISCMADIVTSIYCAYVGRRR